MSIISTALLILFFVSVAAGLILYDYGKSTNNQKLTNTGFGISVSIFTILIITAYLVAK